MMNFLTSTLGDGFAWALTLEGWVSLAALSLLEIVLGVDNIVVLAIVSSRLPPEQRPIAQRLGLLGALVLRIAMLFALIWLIRLTQPIFSLGDFSPSWRDIIMLAGGVFLLWKATVEIHQEVEGGGDNQEMQAARPASFLAVVSVIMVIDAVFALDSVLTAVAMTSSLTVMIIANVIAIALMMLLARAVSAFIERHPAVKILALGFVMLVGVMLVADGFGVHIPREYLYFAIGFSLVVELLNMRARREDQASQNRSKTDAASLRNPADKPPSEQP